MKFKTVVFLIIFLVVFSNFVFADDVATSDESKATVALLFVNNAKTTYDNEINKKMMDNFNKTLTGKYNIVPGERFIDRLNQNGITDVTTAERADVVNAFKGENIDYVLYVELQPFIRKEKHRIFSYGKDMTATVPIKIMDLQNNKYLYNGKFTELASDSSMLPAIPKLGQFIGGIGDRSVAMKAIDQVIEKMNSVIQTRLPLDKSINQ